MKLLSAEQIRAADAHTISHEPIASIDLMERASNVFVDAFESSCKMYPKEVSIFCGTGNNGGDGLVIARLLSEKGWKVDCYIVQFSEKVSEDNRINQQRLAKTKVSLRSILTPLDFPNTASPIVIDALVGTGITRPLEGLLGEVTKWINASGSLICSVDLPSGLYDRGDCSQHKDQIIHADFTFTFQTAKRNFLLPDYAEVVGNWCVLDIGLDSKFIESLPCNEFIISKEQIRTMLQPRSAFSHKGTYGHAALICGSKGMLGAAVLCTSASLRSGAGLTTIFVPEVGYQTLQTTCPEAMCLSSGEDHLQLVPELEKYTAIGIGPGLGSHPQTKSALLEILKSCKQPMVLDADALNLLSENDLALLPDCTVITPHPKEFARFFGKTTNSTERLELARAKAKEHNCIVLLKDRYSSICLPDGTVYFNPTGNPGMAKGGSGDVLTGLITGLITRGYDSKEAAIIGCYLHGLAGDVAAEEVGMEAMTAGDLVHFISEGFKLSK